MPSIKNYLLLVRVHTASLTQAALILGVLLAGISLWSWDTLFWCSFAVLFHATGFLHNNLTDYEHDLKDPHKKGHPLVDGTIGVLRAYQIDIVLHAVLIFVGVMLTRAKLVPTLILFITVFTGWAYNWFCKQSLTSPVFISLSFGLLILIPYTTYTDGIGSFILVVTAYAISQMWYQIAVEGYLKDIRHDPVNLLVDLGCSVKKRRLKVTRKAWAFTIASKLPMPLIGGVILYNHFNVIGVIALVLGTVCVYASMRVLLSSAYKHKRIVRHSALTEIATYFTLVWLIAPVIGVVSGIFLTIYPLIWYVLWNRYYFGTVLRPKV